MQFMYRYGRKNIEQHEKTYPYFSCCFKGIARCLNHTLPLKAECAQIGRDIYFNEGGFFLNFSHLGVFIQILINSNLL